VRFFVQAGAGIFSIVASGFSHWEQLVFAAFKNKLRFWLSWWRKQTIFVQSAPEQLQEVYPAFLGLPSTHVRDMFSIDNPNPPAAVIYVTEQLSDIAYSRESWFF